MTLFLLAAGGALVTIVTAPDPSVSSWAWWTGFAVIFSLGLSRLRINLTEPPSGARAFLWHAGITFASDFCSGWIASFTFQNHLLEPPALVAGGIWVLTVPIAALVPRELWGRQA